NKHSNTLAAIIVGDLLTTCEPMRSKATAGRLVYDVNAKLHFGTSLWNIDLAMGPPAGPVVVPEAGIDEAPPSTFEIAIEIKGVMTEHRKAVKNRKRDFEAHHQHDHNYSNRAIAGVVMVINAAPRFQSPLVLDRVTEHKNPTALVAHCMNEMRAVTTRSEVEGRGIDAGCVLVVVHDNIDPAPTRYWTQQPAPQVGDPLHYDAFIQKLCFEYVFRFP
ncbi:MAG: hypothetical protein ACREJP_01985, partial [Candidatus Methylomirabilales bacterium]